MPVGSRQQSAASSSCWSQHCFGICMVLSHILLIIDWPINQLVFIKTLTGRVSAIVINIPCTVFLKAVPVQLSKIRWQHMWIQLVSSWGRGRRKVSPSHTHGQLNLTGDFLKNIDSENILLAPCLLDSPPGSGTQISGFLRMLLGIVLSSQRLSMKLSLSLENLPDSAIFGTRYLCLSLSW